MASVLQTLASARKASEQVHSDSNGSFWMKDVDTKVVAKVPRTAKKEVVLLNNDGSGKKVFPTREKFDHAVSQLKLLCRVIPNAMICSFGNADPQTLSVPFSALPGSTPLKTDAIHFRTAYGTRFQVAGDAAFGTEVLTSRTNYTALAEELAQRSGNKNYLVEMLVRGAVAQYLVGAGDISMLDFAVAPDRSGICMFDAADPGTDDFKKPILFFVDEVWARPLSQACSLRAFLTAHLDTQAGRSEVRTIVLETEDALARAIVENSESDPQTCLDSVCRLERRACRLVAALSLSSDIPALYFSAS